MQHAARMATPGWNAQTAALFSGLLIVDSFHYIFARLLLPHIHPLASAFWVLAVGALEVALFAGLRGELNWRPLRTHFWFFAAIGFLIAASTVLSGHCRHARQDRRDHQPLLEPGVAARAP